MSEELKQSNYKKTDMRYGTREEGQRKTTEEPVKRANAKDKAGPRGPGNVPAGRGP
jgi:hypothetical protein